jgi:UDP-galactopyranose mutase
MALKFLVIGSGFSGAVLAHELAKNMDCHIDIWEERNHIAGNCHTSRDAETGIMVHRYGPHIFNTNKKETWDYVNSFSEFRPYVHRVKAVSHGEVYSFPLNLLTLNQFFKNTFSPKSAKEFFENISDKSISDPKNFEEQALAFIGEKLYNAFFKGYTRKQWGCEPKQLPASVLKRIPVRFNYDDNYHDSIYTGIPTEGYTDVIEKLLSLPNIQIHLNKKYKPSESLNGFDHIFYTGALDAFFDFEYGKLGYRTVTFESSVHNGDFQGTAQINYCDEEIPYTRITEHKHFTPWENHEKTIVFKEFSKETGPGDIPYYPKRLKEDKFVLMKYRQKANALTSVSFLGRLATYRYMDMDDVIEEARNFSVKFMSKILAKERLPVFPNQEK